MTNTDISEVSLLIKRDFSLDHSELVHQTTLSELLERLAQIVRHLLDKDFESLLHAMYRIDIDEEKLKTALASDPPDNVPSKIATLILERELQKVETRKKYRK